MDCADRPFAFRTDCFSFRLIRFSVTPEMVTSRTPGTPESSGVAVSARTLPIASLSPLLAETPSAKTGTESKEPERTLAVASDGRERLASAEFRLSLTYAVLVP